MKKTYYKLLGLFVTILIMQGCATHQKFVNKYNSWVGKDIHISTYEPIDEEKTLNGKLLPLNDNSSITVSKDGKDVIIERKNIAKAKVNVVL